VSQTKRPPRRATKRPERTTLRSRHSQLAPPAEEGALTHLRSELTRAEAERRAAERALAGEKEERCREAAQLGEMMAHVSKLEARARSSDLAFEDLRSELQEERRRGSELEMEMSRLRIDLETERSLCAVRGEELETERLRRHGLEQELHSAKVVPRPTRHSQKEMPATQSTSPSVEVSLLTEQLEVSRAESRALRESLESLQKRTQTVGAGLKEMRELMVESAALFDELEERERAIAEVRGRSLREARSLFMRAAGRGPTPPPLPDERAPLEDLSDAAELLEEEMRASLRPNPARVP
jgi:hypothetical protein